MKHLKLWWQARGIDFATSLVLSVLVTAWFYAMSLAAIDLLHMPDSKAQALGVLFLIVELFTVCRIVVDNKA
jgi:hypothetical protein